MVVLGHGRSKDRPHRLRIEDLIRINVHRRITNKDRMLILDRDGNRFDFIDERSKLVLYRNGVRTPFEVDIAEVETLGIHGEMFIRYFAWVNGKRVRYLYLDLAGRRVGSRTALGAAYTSNLVRNTKQQQPWRRYQQARKGKDVGQF